MMNKGVKYVVCGEYNPGTGAVGKLWLIVTVPNDKWQSGETIIVNGREYVLGKRDIDKGEISSYELIVKNEVLEIE